MQSTLPLAIPTVGDIASTIIQISEQLMSMLAAGQPVSRQQLSDLMTRQRGASDADGAWSMRDAYEALELACVLLLRDPAARLIDDVCDQATLAALDALSLALPTQSDRSEGQIERQQFSTPLPLAWAVGRAAQLRPHDLVLEPSASTGLLAVHAARRGCRLILNEIDPRRAALLAAAFPTAALHCHDGELIDDRLDPALRPSVVLMNPPFSRSEGRGSDRHAAARHLHAAMKRLAHGGRLVAIMPEWFAADSAERGLGTLRLNLRLERSFYARHGTSISVRLIVYDRLQDTTAPLVATIRNSGELQTALARLAPRTTLCTAAPAPASPMLLRRAALSLLGNARKLSAPRPSPSRASSAPRLAVQPVDYEVLDEPAPAGEQVGIYLPYRPSRIRFRDAARHPTPLVESVAMGSIAAPKPSYVPLLPAPVIAQQLLSEAQLETLVYASEAFERDLLGRFKPASEGTHLVPAEDGAVYRAGYFLGDGTGVGKGRQVAAIILDQWLRGRRRHIWLSKNEALLEDARRDWAALGGIPTDIQPLGQWKLGAPIDRDEGILFVTYPTLRSQKGDKGSRLRQILDWAGDDFEGVIAADEAHAMANATDGEGRFGATRGSEQGLAGIRLQNLLPRARVLLASATGASDVDNLSYATRLGLWGPGTVFATRDAFITAIRAGGIAAMELVARDLKAMGRYLARALSFAGVQYDILEHKLTDEQIVIYDTYAEAWGIIHRNLQAALAVTRVVDREAGRTLNGGARSAALSMLESARQRFFSQLLISMKLPTLIRTIERDLRSGKSVVIQLVSTSEAMLNRRLAELSAAERANLEIELSPRELVIDYLTSAFPIRQMRVFADDEGNLHSEPMSDEDGKPVFSQELIRLRDEMVEKLCAMPAVGSALDALIAHFGADQVAEVTGRTRRIIVGADGRQKIENRSARTNLVETEMFMRGDKRILVFSDAGGTGRSYHASLDAPNQQQRVHYLLEPGWRADNAIQGLGRTHRMHQACPPIFRLVTTDCRGERRFISTIARRLDSLGALTRGQRQTGGQNLFDPGDNLESDHAKEALVSWFHLLHAGKLTSTSLANFQYRTGLTLEAEGGRLREELPPIQRWLNRILALPIGLQNAIFEEYLSLVETRINAAREAGTLDIGVETIRAERLTIVEDQVIRRDPISGATTHLLKVEAQHRIKPMRLARLEEWWGASAQAVRLVNTRSGKAALRLPARSLMTDQGEPIRRFELIRPSRREYIDADDLLEARWAAANEETFAAAWNAEVAAVEAKTRTETLYLATGLLLPVWHKLPDTDFRVWRLTTDDGQSVLGRIVPAHALAALGQKLGLTVDVVLDPAQIVQAVLHEGRMLDLNAVEPIRLKRSLVNGSNRLEVLGYGFARLAWY